jgi:hypothetical protein
VWERAEDGERGEEEAQVVWKRGEEGERCEEEAQDGWERVEECQRSNEAGNGVQRLRRNSERIEEEDDAERDTAAWAQWGEQQGRRGEDLANGGERGAWTRASLRGRGRKVWNAVTTRGNGHKRGGTGDGGDFWWDPAWAAEGERDWN